VGLFVNATKKLHTGDRLHWELRNGYRLTENLPVAQILPSKGVGVDVQQRTSKETDCS